MERQVTVEDVTSVQKRLHVTIGAAEVDQELDKAYQGLVKTVKVKGFRPGKAPRSVLRQQYGQRVNAEVANNLIANSYPEIMSEYNIKPAAQPTIEEIDLKPGADFKFTAMVEVQPEVKLEQYSGLELTEPTTEVSDEMVERQLEMVRESQATLAPLTEDRPVKADDWVTADYQIFVDDKPLDGGKVENHNLEVGSGRFNETFEQKLIGAVKDQHLAFDVDFPADYREDNLAGKTARFEVLVKDIKTKILPPLDDSLGQTVAADIDTLDALRARLRRDLERRQADLAEQQVRDSLLGQLRERAEFELPPTMIADELESMIRAFKQRLAGRGADVTALGLDDEKLGQDLRPRAEDRIRDRLILEYIADKENIQVNPEDEDAEFAEMAEQTGQQASFLRDFYTKNRYMDDIRDRIREQKTLKFLRGVANIKASGTISPEEAA